MLSRLGKRLLFFMGSYALLTLLLYYTFFFLYRKDLPSLDQLEVYKPSLITRIYSADNQLLKEFFVQRRILVPLDQIPDYLVQAVQAVEDRRFMEHWGVDVSANLRALYVDLMAWRFVQGASTLTQQLARELFLTKKQTLSRKIKEALVAIQIEQTYSKEEILQMYLNQHYFGHGAYGVEAAAEVFFSKSVEELTVAEAALLVGLLKSPTYYSPINYPKAALKRRNLVLDAMAEMGVISPQVAQQSKTLPVGLRPNLGNKGEAPYFVEHVRRLLENKYGSSILYEEGVSVYTSLDLRLQRLAERAFQEGIAHLDSILRPEALTGVPLDSLDESIRNQKVQGALVAIDPHNGHIRAMIGGRDFAESEFNRATQALRQPGSAFKIFTYTAAIDNGFTPADIFWDEPVVLDDQDQVYAPQNYDRKWLGPIPLRVALNKSRNLVAIRLLQQIGPEQAVFYAHQMGIKSPLRPVLSLAIGTSEVTVLELTSAYGTFPNGGIHVDPIAILRIVDRNGNVIYENVPNRQEVLSPQTTYIMTSLLQSVIDHGTGVSARIAGFTYPAGGKTGTTDNYADAWFVGFTPHLVCGVRVGYDNLLALGRGQTGSRVALPIWTAFMKAVYEGMKRVDFTAPATGLVERKICVEGAVHSRRNALLASKLCPNPQEEVFKQGTEPTDYCTYHPTLANQRSEWAKRQNHGDSRKRKKDIQF